MSGGGGGWEKVKSSSRSFDLGGGNGGGGIVIGRERLRSIDLSDHSSSPSPNSAGSSAPVIPPTRTVTLGRVEPQHPAHRSIVCNDREANFLVRFKFFDQCSPVSPITNVVPLSLVLFASLVKEAWEDWKRLHNDKAINKTAIDALQDKDWETISWKQLQVGDIVRVKQDSNFPADLLFLASTNPDGGKYNVSNQITHCTLSLGI
ncbi:hypothetical protein C5167_042608 [Papaver somniferum]|uniref:P-type ATPase N-terminal domain-containing protein n=1 Tax=Papaver somniferum TaxID=3469 RepID=A0A4Y7L3B0_PAPSO|nr:hypothetical protein C5167_042608 [Papaver somniferum]